MVIYASRLSPGLLRSVRSVTCSTNRIYNKQRPGVTPLKPLQIRSLAFASEPISKEKEPSQSALPPSPPQPRETHHSAPSIKEKLPDPEQTPFRFREFDLHDKVFVVTGGGRGLGLTLAEALVEAGGKVYCLDRLAEPEKEFRVVQERLGPKYGGGLFYDHVDVREAGNLDRVISEIAERHGRMDGLIANAAVQNVTPALDYTPEKIMEMLDVNYKGVYRSAVSAARQMIRYNCSGSILLVASMSGLVANRDFTSSVYNSSKAAVCQLARSLAMEWGKIVNGRPIRVNALCPGNIITPMVLKNFEDQPELKEKWENQNMLGRLSEPREYRGAALLCLSDASSFMTGSNLVIDGGYTAW
ncbi:uncharacterized protein PV06_08831 [Exophiala oligosperma]|uniref:Uncharacterized protein n=1 Tax=Exophiala oligosperma TaxID=215243 RepID=A0A0D2DTV2_9EURO|nr:uncharacterized protein PV06_08831 [Exophiala oligosperma]KIW39014.1 hypothetical protein PV06_08831 [Exophiala oligosperma]